MNDSSSALRYFSEDTVSIGAECPNCGRVLKVYKTDLQSNESGFISNRNIPCPCGHQYLVIELGNSERNSTTVQSVGKAPTKQAVVKCPRCSSTQVTGFKKGFGVGKAVGGGVLLGPLGVLGGFIGSRKVMVGCLKCGHRWKP